jgi:hypothetical protein
MAALLPSEAATRAFKNHDVNAISQMVLRFVTGLDAIKPATVLHEINSDRKAAGITLIADVSALQVDLENVIRRHRDALNKQISDLGINRRVELLTTVVDLSTSGGEHSPPSPVVSLVDAYERGTREESDSREAAIHAQIIHIESLALEGSPATSINAAVQELTKRIHHWDQIAQPLQVLRFSRGEVHQASADLARQIRKLGLTLYNEHSLVQATRLITECLKTAFAEIPEFMSLLKKDSEALSGFKKQSDEEWAKSITFESNSQYGRLKISPRGVEYQGQTMALENIWIVKVVQGARLGLRMGDSSHSLTVTFHNNKTFSAFMGRFLTATTPKIIGSLVQGIRDGNIYQFGDAHLTDEGFLVSRSQVGRGTNAHVIPWQSLKCWNSNGSWIVQDSSDERWMAAIPFSTDNSIYLDALTNRVKRNQVSRISELPD